MAGLSSLAVCSLRPNPTQVEHLSGALLFDTLLALLANNRLGSKGLPSSNTLAHYKD